MEDIDFVTEERQLRSLLPLTFRITSLVKYMYVLIFEK